MKKEKTDSEKAAEDQAALEAKNETERLEKEKADKVEADAAAKLEADRVEAERLKAKDQEKAEELSKEEFTKIADQFGAEIAVQTVKDGGNYQTALKAHADALKAENEKLTAKVTELEAAQGNGTPAKVKAAAGDKKQVFNTQK